MIRILQPNILQSIAVGRKFRSGFLAKYYLNKLGLASVKGSTFNLLSLLLLSFNFTFVSPINAQTTTVTLTSGTSFSVPIGVTSIFVECWGGGGGGGGAKNNTFGSAAGGGGGGGSYAAATISVNPLQTFSYSIGSGGSAGSGSPTAGGTGGTTSFNTSTVVALGGGGGGSAGNGSNGAAGAGGAGSSSTGTTKWSGGAGRAGNRGNYGGGGGAGGNLTAIGATATTGAGATGAPNPPVGNGGSSSSANATGGDGGTYASGGAGGASNSGFGGNKAGGAGAQGVIRITYTLPACSGTPIPGTASISSASGCGGVNFTLSATALASATGISFQWQSSPAGANTWSNISGATAATWTTNTFASTDYRYVTTCSNSGLTNVTNTVTYTANGPSNPICSLATNLPCGTVNLAGSTVCTPNYAHGTPYSIGNYGVWYTFTGNGVSNTITISSVSGFDPELVILSGSCGSFTGVADVDGGSTNANETATFSTTSGVTYYVYVAHYNTTATTGTFNISRTSAAPATPSAITGITTPCSGTTQTYSVTNVAGTTYAWALPSGWSGSSTTNSITVTAGSPGIISVTADQNCGPSAPSNLVVMAKASPTSVDAGTNTSICAGASTALAGTAIAGASPGTTAAQQNVMGTTVTDISNTEVSVTLAGAPAGATITGITFTPRVRLEGGSFNFGCFCIITNYSDCSSYGSYYKMQYWDGSAWIDIASCNAPLFIDDLNGLVVNGTVLKIRTIDLDGSDNIRTDLLNVTVNYNTTGTVSYDWTSAPAGFTSSIANPSVSPGVATTYTLTATSNGCSVTDDVTISVNPSPAATITSSSTSLCHGNTYTIGGNVTASGSWTLNLSDGQTATGTGNQAWSVTAIPTATTTYTISSLNGPACAVSASLTGSTTLTLPTAGTDLATDNETATCHVSGGNWIHFYSAGGKLIASINPGGNDLGSVTATAYVDGSSILTQACGTGSNPSSTTAALGRRWVITPTNNLPASIKFPFGDGELTNLQSASAGTTANVLDDVNGIADLKMSHYSGTAQNGSWSDNCVDGGSEIVPVQVACGSTTTGNGFMSTVSGSSFVQFNTPGFSEFWLHNSNNASPLPVELLTFSASCNTTHEVSVSWSTASEMNSQKFVIEKSRDLTAWNYAGEHGASGNSNYKMDYVVTDPDPFSGISYYRLVQVDNDGAEKIYAPISVSCSGKDNSMLIFPNPSKGNFTVEIISSETINNAEIQLADLTGKIISSRSLSLVEGINQVLFDESSVLQPGTYFVRLVSGSEFKPVKVVVN